MIGGFESYDELYTYLTALGLGMSMLFSFNSFISAPDYVQNYYQYASNDEFAVAKYPDFWQNAESYISVSNMIPNLIFQGFVFTPVIRRIPMQRKILVAMTLVIFAMLLIPVMPAFSVSEVVAAATLMFASALAGAATAFFQSTAFGLVACCPAKHMGGILFGIGVSGTTTSLLQIITKAAMGSGYNDSQTQSRVYFGVAIGFMIVSFISVIRLKKNRYAQRYIVEYRDETYVDDGFGVGSGNAAGVAAATAPAVTAENNAGEDYLNPGSAESLASANRFTASVVEDGETSALIKGGGTDHRQAEEHGGATEYEAQESVSILPVVKQIWPMMFSCSLTFFITLTVFPGVGVAINNSSAWFGVIIIFLFNFGDTIGRFGSNIPRIWIPRKYVPFAATCRLVVIPLFFFCITPHWIPGNVFPMILMFVTGVSNGFIGSMALVYGPQTEALRSDGERALAGNAMSMSLLTGCSAGSLLALLITSKLPST
ncbi:nucleobase transporter, putative [Bodo saltans]|uniref:Nucleobase transporter, putative n=1 Tax=Bodo saltans TaxID=75058 RepID=A0A0S4JBS4_BODSA|nr:nucleobase transporter, putative [Bodo saltans]|eukprot:CUG87641.1 nucleobase transporter, putative [Bodo saltans]